MKNILGFGKSNKNTIHIPLIFTILEAFGIFNNITEKILLIKK